MDQSKTVINITINELNFFNAPIVWMEELKPKSEPEPEPKPEPPKQEGLYWVPGENGGQPVPRYNIPKTNLQTPPPAEIV